MRGSAVNLIEEPDDGSGQPYWTTDTEYSGYSIVGNGGVDDPYVIEDDNGYRLTLDEATAARDVLTLLLDKLKELTP